MYTKKGEGGRGGEMTNVEIKMTKEGQMSKSKRPGSLNRIYFVIRASSFLRHLISTFVIPPLRLPPSAFRLYNAANFSNHTR